MITYAMLKDLMEPDEFVLALELMNKTTGHTNTAKRVARNIYVLANLLRLVDDDDLPAHFDRAYQYLYILVRSFWTRKGSSYTENNRIK